MRLAILLAVAACLPAQPEGAGWSAMGPGAALQTADGVSTLRYEIRPGQLSAAVMPAPLAMARMRALRFRARADHDTAMAILLNEKPPGGHYAATFWAPANRWQEIELSPADFALSEGPQDPPDPDGRLDAADVLNIGILDLSQIFAAARDNPDFPGIIDRPLGPHAFAIQDFVVLEKGGAVPAAGVIDRFEREFLAWFTLGGMKLERSAAGNPLGAPALQASYQESEKGFALLVRPLANLDLSKARRLEFDIASEQEITLAVALEGRQPGASNGPRYNMTIYPPGKREVFHVSLRLEDFSGPGKPDPARLKSLSLVDVSSMAGGAAAPANTIWIGNLRATP